MWYEIIPSYLIITAVMAVPAYSCYFTNKWLLGNGYRREMRFGWERHMYQRDRRLVGNPYLSPGLEAIPDE